MAHAYTPGLKVARKNLIKKRRILPLKGKVIKKVGDIVRRSDVVAQTSLPGNVRTVNVVNLLGINPDEISKYMLFKEGDSFKEVDILAQNKPFIKWFQNSIKAPCTGEVESISPVTGQVILREPPLKVEVMAYIDGEVIEAIAEEGVVVESAATFVQGIFGIGGEVWGELKFAVNSPREELTVEKVLPSFKDKVIIGGSFACIETIKKCIAVGVKGLIVGGIRDGDLRELLGYDLGVAITGSEEIGLTLILTEGFGDIFMAEKTFKVLKEREGELASINGATQIRAGVMRPEIIIPYSDKQDLSDLCESSNYLEIGTSIRVIRQPYFGKLGSVHSLPPEPQKIESETKTRVLEVKFEDGTIATVPRANVELIEE